MKFNENKFRLEGIQPPPVLLGCPKALLSNESALFWSEDTFFVKNLIQFFHFR